MWWMVLQLSLSLQWKSHECRTAIGLCFWLCALHRLGAQGLSNEWIIWREKSKPIYKETSGDYSLEGLLVTKWWQMEINCMLPFNYLEIGKRWSLTLGGEEFLLLYFSEHRHIYTGFKELWKTPILCFLFAYLVSSFVGRLHRAVASYLGSFSKISMALPIPISREWICQEKVLFQRK